MSGQPDQPLEAATSFLVEQLLGSATTNWALVDAAWHVVRGGGFFRTLPPADPLGTNFLELVAPGSRDGLVHAAEEARRLGSRSRAVGIRLLLDDGARRLHARVELIPIAASAPRDAPLLLSLVDDTEAVTSIEALSVLSDRYRTLFESARDAILIEDDQHRFVEANEAAATLFGYRREELLTMSLADLRAESSAFDPADAAADGPFGPVEFQAVCADGVHRTVDLTITPLRQAGGHHFLIVGRDVTERRRDRERLEHLATHDALTGLPTRALLFDRLAVAIGRAMRETTYIAVMLIDLDNFKEVNDTHGHAAGDTLLAKFAQRVNSRIRAGDTFARFGGDEFVLLLPDVNDIDQVERLGLKLLSMLEAPFHVDGATVQVSASIGLALYPNDATQADDLLRCADAAMYEAKRLGRRRAVRFAEGMRPGPDRAAD